MCLVESWLGIRFHIELGSDPFHGTYAILEDALVLLQKSLQRQPLPHLQELNPVEANVLQPISSRSIALQNQ